jgi:SurA N-terminal domain/PPIC-type PPIASE domain
VLDSDAMLLKPAHGLLLAAVVGLAACSTEDMPVIGQSAATFDGGSIKMSEYRLRLKVLQENYRKQTQTQGEQKYPSIDSPAGRDNETTLETEAVQDLVDAVLLQREAEKYGINVTEDDINKQVDPFRTNYDAQVAQQRQQGVTAPTFNAYLNTLGYSLDRLREQVRSRLYEQRLEAKLALQRKVSALAALRSGTDIAAVAKKYSDDVASANAAGALSVHTADVAGVPQLKPAIEALQPGQSSADFAQADDGYYFFKLTSRDADTTKMQYVYIYDPKPELYSNAKRPKWLVDLISQREKQAHVKYSVGSHKA